MKWYFVMSVNPIGLVLCLLAFPALATAHGPLDPYLLNPGDVPAQCERVTGLFPTNPKVDSFYQYQVYREAVPAPVERHAQSFDCAGQKGTLYYFAYAKGDQAEAARLFAKPVLTRGPAAPVFREWKKGFVIVSYANPPEELLQALDRKIGARPVAQAPMAVVSATTAAPSSAMTTTAPAPSPARAPAPITAPPLAAPPEKATSAPVTPQVIEPPDIPNEVIKKLMDRAGCSDRSNTDDGKAACGLLRDFERSDTFAASIPPNEPKIGMVYLLDSQGGVGSPRYQAAIGSGKLGDVSLVDLFLESGVDEFQAQDLIKRRIDHQPWPSNELTATIARFKPAGRTTVIASQGRSLVSARSSNRVLYIRRSNKGTWLLVGVMGTTVREQLQSDATVGTLD